VPTYLEGLQDICPEHNIIYISSHIRRCTYMHRSLRTQIEVHTMPYTNHYTHM